MNETGSYNLYVGTYSGQMSSSGSWNTFVGAHSGRNSDGNRNTFVGYYSGSINNGSNNVFLGYNAGKEEAGSNKLIIANGHTEDSTLIYGEFDNDYLKINATTSITNKLGVGTTTPSSHIHIVGDPTLGQMIIAPDESGNNGNSELVFAEDDDYTYGMSFYYDGTDNQLEVRGKSGISNYGPHMIIERDNGNITMPAVYDNVIGENWKYLKIDSEGNIGTAIATAKSTRNMKDILPINNNSWLYELKPIQFHLKDSENNELFYGIDAVSAVKANPNVVMFDNNQQPIAVDENKLIPALVKELQNKDKEINELQNKVSSLEERLQALEKEIRQ